MLRSVKSLQDYHVEAKDGAVGHVEDVIIEEQGWLVRYIVVDLRNWLRGKRVIVAPDWIDGIDPLGRTVSLTLSREEVRNSPPYDPTQPVNREYEVHLYDYYGRPKYWT